MMILKLFLYNLSRKINKVFILPMNYTYSFTSICDSKCKTCNIWMKNEKELTTKEWEKIIKLIGKSPYWITITGGNQFLRKDFNEIMEYIIKYNKPKIINIPISGTLPNLVLKKIKTLLIIINKYDKKTKLILNISIDGIEKSHDKIRGVKNSFKNSIKLIEDLKLIKKKANNLTIGTYTVISKYNYNEFEKIKNYIINQIKPDQFGFELAENRFEYGNINDKIIPNTKSCIKILNKCIKKNKKHMNFILNFKEFIRKKYYKYVINILASNNKNKMDCYAGIASIQISTTGKVWQCCTKSKIMGNLRKNKYDFNKIFFSNKANLVRKKIKMKKCFCIHSNPFYTNYICSLKIK
jgi:MoaA/NifB/PqqE/SkfB family radical SAM enzyme